MATKYHAGAPEASAKTTPNALSSTQETTRNYVRIYPTGDKPYARTLARRTYLHEQGQLRVYPRRLDIEPYPTEIPPPPPRRTIRGNVTAFTRKSRYNMFRQLAAVQLHRHSWPWWISLTYHERCPAGRWQVLADIAAWTERVRRRFPAFVYMRKLEPQQRTYPHWHIIGWSHAYDTEFESFDTAIWLAQQWHEIADPTSEAHAIHGTLIEPVRTYKSLVVYVSKYCAKVDDGEEWPFPGRRWSCSYHLQRKPLSRIEATSKQIVRLKRAARLLMRMRATTQRHLGHLRRYQSEVTLFLREGEPERLLAIAGIDTPGEVPRSPPYIGDSLAPTPLA